MHKIDVDSEVFAMLQDRATPFVDTPNSVLRRVLGLNGRTENEPKNKAKRAQTHSNHNGPSSDAYVKFILREKFGGQERKVPGFKTMYECQGQKVYFQNYNKAGDEFVWYRLSGSPWKSLMSDSRNAVVCFTNPAEGFAYTIPVLEILHAVSEAGEDTSSIEVIIYPASHRWKWRNLEWDVGHYFERFAGPNDLTN